MSSLQLIDFPSLITTEEVQTGSPVRAITWQKVAHLTNYLNCYARSIIPYSFFYNQPNLGGSDPGIQTVTFPFEFTDAGFADNSRYLYIIAAVQPNRSADATPTNYTITFSSANTLDSVTRTLNSNPFPYIDEDTADQGIEYIGVTLEVANDGSAPYTDEITIDLANENATNGPFIIGFGAYELPMTDDGTKPMSGPGVQLQKAVAVDTWNGGDTAIDPYEFGFSDYMDQDVGHLATHTNTTLYAHAPYLFSAPSCIISTGTGTNDVPSCGIYIPPLVHQSGQTSVEITCAVNVVSRTDTIMWSVTSSIGTSTPTSITESTGLSYHTASVGVSGEWIYFTYNGTDGTSAITTNAIYIWISGT